MASAVDQLVNGYNTSEPVSFYDYYNAYGQDHSGKFKWTNANPYGLGANIDNFFRGIRSGAEQDYNKYLSEFEYRKNEKATSAANALTFAREDSQIQRLLADYKAAGLNPYALLTGGNLSSGVVSSQAQRPIYKRSSKKETSKNSDGSKVVSSAIRAIAMIAMLA